MFTKTDVDQTRYDLPNNTEYITDPEFVMLDEISEKMGKEFNDFPVFVVLKDNKIYFISKGYTIGISEQMIKIIQKIE